jgi:hypothetical protein
LHDLPEHALAALIEKKLAAQGVTLSERQRKRLTRKLMRGDADNIRLWNWTRSWLTLSSACWKK